MTSQNPFDEHIEFYNGDMCPICGNPIVYEEGLEVCYYCGWSQEDKDECTE